MPITEGYDYPLIKVKYLLLLVITPLILTETIMQAKYFLGLNPEIITSCCGSLFTADTQGVASEIISLPHSIMEIVFYAAMMGSLVLGDGVLSHRENGLRVLCDDFRDISDIHRVLHLLYLHLFL